MEKISMHKYKKGKVRVVTYYNFDQYFTAKHELQKEISKAPTAKLLIIYA